MINILIPQTSPNDLGTFLLMTKLLSGNTIQKLCRGQALTGHCNRRLCQYGTINNAQAAATHSDKLVCVSEVESGDLKLKRKPQFNNSTN